LMNTCCFNTAASSVGAYIFGVLSTIHVPLALPVPRRSTSACTAQRALALAVGRSTGAGCSAGARRSGCAEGGGEGAGVGGGALITASRSTTSRAAMRRTTSPASTQAATDHLVENRKFIALAMRLASAQPNPFPSKRGVHHVSRGLGGLHGTPMESLSPGGTGISLMG
jgi:hypothetical protein